MVDNTEIEGILAFKTKTVRLARETSKHAIEMAWGLGIAENFCRSAGGRGTPLRQRA